MDWVERSFLAIAITGFIALITAIAWMQIAPL
jgi:hypothetical protein